MGWMGNPEKNDEEPLRTINRSMNQNGIAKID
jgi:hypothetical protein